MKSLSFFRRCSFTTEKYFKDIKYKNCTAIATDKPGTLRDICQQFTKFGINLTYARTYLQNIQKGKPKTYCIDLSYQSDPNVNFPKIKSELKQKGVILEEKECIQVPWFPRNYNEIDKIGKVLLDVKEDKNHDQFQDVEYRKRRDFIAQVALKYKMGDPIPDIPYTKDQTQLWVKICKKLHELHKHSMSERFLAQSQQLEKQFKISQRIPQLGELSNYLYSKTGFSIKPTHGILSQRQFLNAFAFKIFCSTQYIRNTKNPDYTPQPDIVHEIVGHVPMFADPDIAKLSHKIGLLSLGASDEDIAKLGSLYWFTLEFGVCKQNGKNLGYGAGIASSIGQIEHMLSDKAQFKKFEPFYDCTQPYPVQTVQPLFRVTQSFSDSVKQLQRYGRTVMKPMTTVYNELTHEIEYERNIEAVYTEDKGPKF